MRLVRIQYLLLITVLILAAACNANPSGGASGPSTWLRTGPTSLPPGPELKQPIYTVVAVPAIQTSDWISNSCNVASSVESALQ